MSDEPNIYRDDMMRARMAADEQEWQNQSELSPAHGSDAGRDFEAWWGRNCYSIRDMIAGEVIGSSERLHCACLKVWSASREHPNDPDQRPGE